MHAILETTKFVVDRSKEVHLDAEYIEKFCDSFKKDEKKYWLDFAPLDIRDLELRQRIFFLLLLDSMSFSYWADPLWNPRKKVWEELVWSGGYRGVVYNGAWGLVANLTKALLNGSLRLECDFLRNMTEKQFAEIIGGKAHKRVPLFQERYARVQELGEVLFQNFGGDVLDIFQGTSGSAEILLQKVVKYFTFFRDVSVYGGRDIFFLKRAQLFVADVIQSCGADLGFSRNTLGTLTACADYKLPQVLRQLGVLRYSKELSFLVDHKIPLKKGSGQEVEIRSNTIWAVEGIKEVYKKRGVERSSIEINDSLWLLGQEDEWRKKPYHRTRTTAY